MKPAATTTGTGTGRRSVRRAGALAGALAALWSGGAGAQETGITAPTIERPALTPGLRATALYTDNVVLSDSDERGEYVFEVSPYLRAESNAPRAKYELFYQMRNFWRVRDEEFNLFRHALNGSGSFALVDDRLWVDLTGYMGTVNASATGPLSTDPGSSFTNTANVRRFSVSPWYRDRLGRFATYQLRYFVAHTGGGSEFAVAKLDQRASATVDGYDDGSSPWNWRWYGQFQQREFDNDVTRDRRNSGFVVYYRVNPELRVFGSVDYEQIDGLRNSEGDDYGYGPGFGFDWNPNSRTSVSASVSDRYYGTVGNARAAYSTPNTTMGVSFARSMLTSSDASLLLFDPRSLTSTAIGTVDPVLTNLLSRGIVLPTGIALTDALVTDAAVLDKRLTAFWGLRGARNSLTFSLFASDRESTAELATTTSSGIRGDSTAGGVFVGELRERGAIVSYQHRLDVRSTIDLTLDRRITDSPTADFETRRTSYRAAYGTQLTSNTTAFAGLRHTQQRRDGVAAKYDENAIFGGIDMQFR